MTDRICSIAGCTRSMWARGWCGTHYKRWRLTGTTELKPRVRPSCGVEECDRPVKARGWCTPHYARWRLNGTVNSAKPVTLRSPIVDGGKRCTRCEQWFPLAEFKKTSHGTGGVGTRCLACRRAEANRWREANPDYWKTWQAANQDKVRASVQSRRAARLQQPSETVLSAVVFERDGFTCQLCDGPLDMTARKATPLAPTIDHIVPLVRGGSHLYSNVQAAHFLCNVRKGDRIIPAHSFPAIEAAL